MKSKNTSTEDSIEKSAHTRKLEEQIKELQESNKHLARDRELMANYFETARNVIFRIDLDNVVIGVSHSLEEHFGIKVSEVINQPIIAFHDKIKDNFEDPESYLKYAKQSTYKRHENGSLNILEMSRSGIKLLKPSERQIALLPRDIRKRDGEMVGKILTYVDITELSKTTDLIQTIVETSPVPTIVSRLEDGKIIFVNEPLAALVGMTQDGLVGKQTPDFYADPGAREEVVKRVKKDGYLRNHEVRIKKIDGTVIWMIFNLTITELAGETVIIGALYDIDKRRKAEEELRESEERFRQLAENIYEVFWMTTPDKSRMIYVSPKYDEIWGRDIAELYEKPDAWLDYVHSEDRDRVAAAITGQVSGDYDEVYRIMRPDGSERWIRDTAFPIKDQSGNIYRICGVTEDITESKQVQETLRVSLDDLENANRHLLETQGQLIQSEKMASLGMLVAGIAHEINTPIGAVNSMHNTSVRAMQKLRDELKSFCDAECLDNENVIKTFKLIDEANRVIETGTERVTTIVRRLRSFARLDEAELKEADLHEGLEDTLVLIHHEIKHNIEIVRNYGEIPSISCYPGRLNQVFLNILINGKQAIRDKGKITISTHLDNGKVFIEFADTGMGIPKEKLGKVFDPGFTTKGVGVGTGLGLSICYQIIQDHHGAIRVNSEVGKGTTFTIILPTNLGEIL